MNKQLYRQDRKAPALMAKDEGSDSAKDKDKQSGDVDSSTVFVRNLPFTLTDLQLQEVFSEIGPVRRSFTVKENGANQHRGFGFVQFAVVEDAICAVEAKHGTDLQGRKLKVELAKPRASFEQRRSRKHQELSTVQECKNKEKKEQIFEQGKSSEKQRVARTVILGGLVTPEMREEALECAKQAGSVESVQSSLAAQELKGRGLEQGGCKMGAASVVYTSIKEALHAVSTLHQKILRDGIVWARQLGGEGSKPNKWRVIIRNLPFKVTEKEVRELLSSAGFIWEVKIPHNANGESKGFAFASFTSKAAAEKAIHIANGKIVGKRPVAVDLAVAKKLYNMNVQDSDLGEDPGDVPKTVSSDIEVEETASEKEEDDVIHNRDGKQGVQDDSATQQVSVDGQRKAETSDSDIDLAIEKQHDHSEEPVFFDEMDMARRVLNKVTSCSLGRDPINNELQETHGELQVLKGKDLSADKQSPPNHKTGDGEGCTKAADGPQPTRGDLEKTVFIKNLPFEADADSVKKHFQTFGKVKTVSLVRHSITKRPKGTAFLEFSTEEAAEAAIAAASGTSSEGNAVGGIMYGGRRLGVFRSVDRKSAQTMTKDKLEMAGIDRRNLYLAKEGNIEEGTPAADGVSEEDMQKRKQLDREKATKLRSPNFHVSRTRLAVYNLPKLMKEAEVRKLFIDAVKSRATRQKPVIKQVKILRDEMKGGKSRGVAFVEFSEHQHALVALRVLNNNPETFTLKKRPIVEFAIENMLTLKKRKERQAEAKKSFNEGRLEKSLESYGDRSLGPNKRKRAMIKSSDVEDAGEMPFSERKERREIAQSDLLSPKKGEKIIKARKRKRTMLTKNSDLNGVDERAASLEEGSKKKNRGHEISGSGNVTLNKVNGYPNKKVSPSKKQGKKQKLSSGSPSKPFSREMAGEKKNEIKGHPKEVKNKQKKRNSKPEIEDKLDKLVSEYRNKYFSVASEGTKGNSKLSDLKASSDIKRWFE